jgi:TonB family protein
MSDIEAFRKPSRRLWIYAALGALALHVGGIALAIPHLQSGDSEGGLGAAAIEVGVELASPRVEQTDLPPGPESEASAASPEAAEQKTVDKETDLPKAVPTESDDPDRVVALTDSKKPVEEQPEVPAVQQAASAPAVATEETALRSLEDTAEKEKPTAPILGLGKDLKKLTAEWNGQLSAILDLHKRYPKVRKSKRATVKISFALDRRGHVLSVGVEKSSGDPAFDEAAVSMVRRSDPVPPPPAELTDERFNFVIDVMFNDAK